MSHQVEVYGNNPYMPTGEFAALPSRIPGDSCGRISVINEQAVMRTGRVARFGFRELRGWEAAPTPSDMTSEPRTEATVVGCAGALVIGRD